MMPNQVLSQPIADPPPGPVVRPPIASLKLSRREVFTGVWSRRFASRRGAFGRVLSPKGTAARSPGAGRNRRQSARKGAQR
jgi:hypothetical protein